MLFAHDYNEKRTHINDTYSNQEYYCPYCGAPLVTRKGEVRQHHFAHKKHHLCTDSWERTHSYDVSPWHNDWQSLFPKENQEIMLSLGETRHRADVMIDRTVIEFQHSIMSVKAFDDRNNFYFNLGYKVIWLFDLSELFEKRQLTFSKKSDGLVFNWKNPKRAFNNYDIKSGCIDLFFQLNENENNCIVRVTDVSYSGFEQFCTTAFMGKTEFLYYIGLKNGICLPPCRDDIENNQKYREFIAKYQITLNKQQERALQAVEGSNLLLAVPGSGKTTVLVARLGHMVLNKNIKPQNILAITYNNDAANEMRTRFFALFGREVGEGIDFRTINSLSLKIYTDYCKKHRKEQRKLIQAEDKRKLIARIFKEHNDAYASESDILETTTALTYIKNMMFNEDEIRNIKQPSHLFEIYSSYTSSLKEKKLMDFDDQMVFAYWILNNDKEIVNELKEHYKYICIDEAQDTSKIQHAIIKILAKGNNIFMVGDEDQSIYGFRAAYPKALLNFRYDYSNPYILRMERNYRSTSQIINKAQLFISKNKGRYEKNMTAERGNGISDVQLVMVRSREEQFMHLLNVAKSLNVDTAFLYRDNESAVVLVDLLCRNNISFKLRKPEMNFFGNRVVEDIMAYLSLAVNNKDFESLERIFNKGIIYLKKQQQEFAIQACKSRKISVFDALEEQMKYIEPKYRSRAYDFSVIMHDIQISDSSKAIELLLENGYREYLQEHNFDMGKVEILQILAKQEPDIKKFLQHLDLLKKLMSKEHDEKDENHIILSTVHSSKGLEYDSVYMVDVYDGRFPSSHPNVFCRSKDSASGEQEERRLFYVGITRAKNNLTLFSIANKPSEYIDELFIEQKLNRNNLL